MPPHRHDQWRAVPLVGALPTHCLDALDARAERVTLSSGDDVVRPGDRAECLVLVRSGALEGSEAEALGEGAAVGTQALFCGGAQRSGVRAVAPSEVTLLGLRAFNEVLADAGRTEPAAAVAIGRAARDASSRRTLARVLAGPLELDGVEARQALVQAAQLRTVKAGDALFQAGEGADAWFVVLRGRVVLLPPLDGAPVATVRAGGTVGEEALLTGRPHAHAAVAARETEVARIGRDTFEAMVRREPSFLLAVVRAMLERQRGATTRVERVQEVVAIVRGDETPEVHAVATALRTSVEAAGGARWCDVDTASADLGLDAAEAGDGHPWHDRLEDWLQDKEQRPGWLLLDADGSDPWRARCLSRADRILHLVDARSDVARRPLEDRILARDPRLGPPLELVLVHPADTDRPRGTAAWLDARQSTSEVSAWHHVRAGRAVDADRVARRLTDRAVGLVLGGGGALAAAHVGALAALLERGVPIDYLGGTSAGAGIAAVAAMQLAYEPTHDHIHLEFFDRTPFSLFTLPVLSIFARGPMDAAAKRLFGDIQAEDLWVPWFAVTASLERAALVVHQRGPLWKLTRATSAVPVVSPPVVHDGETLVDGGLLDNYPAGILRGLCGGVVVGVDLSPSSDRTIDYTYDELPSALQILLGRARHMDVPTLAYVTLRVATLGASASGDAVAATDVYMAPQLQPFTPADFGEFEPIAAEGYRTAVAALDARPVPPAPSIWAGPDSAFGRASERFGTRSVHEPTTPPLRRLASAFRAAAMTVLRGQS
ncbi:MAG: NTE family protein [Myxococcota bacterium]